VHLPEQLLQSLQDVKGFDREAFTIVHQAAQQVTSVRVNPAKWQAGDRIYATELSGAARIPWTSLGYYLAERPSFTFDPLFHAGCYYVQEASSMFLELALRQTADLSTPLKVLDLCGAPGGKSTHLQSLISGESLLVTNEVIKSRVLVLEQNIIKWGASNVVITNNDPKHFTRLGSFFDVLVVDAPCSGSGLFRRDPEAIDEWSLNNVALCSQRQQRILSDALPALKEGGILIYSTCSYSKEENEEIGDWLIREQGMEPLALQIEEEWGVVQITSAEGAFGYRFFPDKIKGEGFFLSCFRKAAYSGEEKLRPQKLEMASKSEKAVLEKWVVSTGQEFYKYRDAILAVPQHLSADYTIIKSSLNVYYAGTAIGQVMRDKLVPAHALALSSLLSDAIPSTELSYEQAVKYLQRGEFSVEAKQTGWQVVSYKNHPLGWINALPNRINNYYPKEMRILKQNNDLPFEK
jgi:16S rRNA C967 or C1407 C5-methylase (RsmB/RsmF family)/NOL1/NOP2/fmu family ribosome biogenesis protein